MRRDYLPSRDDLTGIKSASGTHRVGLRAALSVAVPLAGCLLLGHPEWAPYASFGAFTALYGRNISHLYRFRMQAWAAITLVAAVVTGVAISLLHQADWMVVLVGSVIAATGQIIARAYEFHPPGPLFMLFAFGTIASMPHTVPDLWVSALVAAAAASFSMLVGVAGMALKPGSIRETFNDWQPLRRSAHSDSKHWWIAGAVLVSGAVAVIAGIGHPYWAMVAAVAPMSAPHVTQQVSRGIQRTVGTTVGLLGAWALLALHLSPIETVVAVAVLQLVTEMTVGRNYAVACLFITPMALLMGTLGHQVSIATVLWDRGAETFIGSLVAVVLVVTGHILRERRKARVDEALARLTAERASLCDGIHENPHPGVGDDFPRN